VSRQTFLGGDDAVGEAVLALRRAVREIDAGGSQCDWGKICNDLEAAGQVGGAVGAAAAEARRIAERHADRMADGDYGDFDAMEAADARARRAVRALCRGVIRGPGP